MALESPEPGVIRFTGYHNGYGARLEYTQRWDGSRFAIAALTLLPGQEEAGGESAVPALTGRTVAEAAGALLEEGLGLTLPGPLQEDAVITGHQPAPGTRLMRGEAVQVTL